MARFSKTILFLGLMMLLPGLTFAQTSCDSIDLKRIHHKAVRNLVLKERVKTRKDFQSITTACYQAEDSVSYCMNRTTYIVKAHIGKVWEKYANVTPLKAWSGRTIKFGFLFSKPANRFIYAENANEPIQVGNIIYVNLRLLKGIKNLGVAFEITRLDADSKTICLCYLQDGVSVGSQEIESTEMQNGNTLITHVSHYRSHSAFRDRELYPHFHEKFVGEFHQNILQQIETGV